MAIIHAPGAPNANSYVSEAQATAFFAGELDTGAWDLADTITREKALRSATTLLDRLSFVGARESDTQSLEWPRTIGELDGRLVPVMAMPPRLVRVTCRLALALLTEPPTVVLDTQTVVSERLGPIQTEFAGSGNGGNVQPERVGLEKYPQVMAELRGMLDTPIGSMEIERA